ncbi:hypothetical protein WJ972_03875 [Achromobacter insuavis]
MQDGFVGALQLGQREAFGQQEERQGRVAGFAAQAGHGGGDDVGVVEGQRRQRVHADEPEAGGAASSSAAGTSAT